MKKIHKSFLRRLLSCASVFTAACAAVIFAAAPAAFAANAEPATVADATGAALLEKHRALAGQLAQTAYRRPLMIESSEGSDRVDGHAWALLDAPFSTVSATFRNPGHWCEVLILHINTKFCRASGDGRISVLRMNVGKKDARNLDDTFALAFNFRVAADSPAYMSTQLNADKGPLGTSDYRIELEAVPLPDGKSFMHLRYSYGFNVASRIAMQGYLATVGRDKVGFTLVKKGQQSAHVGGVRGTVERNTMRYYLAIEAYLATLSRPVPQQLDARLAYWFDATEQYPEQLHEMTRDEYLAMKKDEYQRQLKRPPG
jgi:hypothetical protein